MERTLSIDAMISFILTNRELAVICLHFMTSPSKLKNGQKCGLKGSEILRSKQLQQLAMNALRELLTVSHLRGGINSLR